MLYSLISCVFDLPFLTYYGFTHIITRYPKQDRVGHNINPWMPFKWQSSSKVASLAAAVTVSLLGRPKETNFPAVRCWSAGHQAVQRPHKKLSKTVSTRWETCFVSQCWLAFMLLPQNKVTPQRRYMDAVQQEVHISLTVSTIKAFYWNLLCSQAR
jgi:hypothetical protein